MSRPSKRFSPAKWQDALIPFLLGLLGLILLIVIVVAVLALIGIQPG